MSALSPDFRDFLEILNRLGVRYLVAGGYAMAFHGRARYTKDIDLWIDHSPDNALRVSQAIADFGFAALQLAAEDFMEPGTIVQLGREPNRIDLLTSLSGLQFEESYAQREQIELDGLPLPFLSKNALLKNKRAVGRPQDLVDADFLES